MQCKQRAFNPFSVDPAVLAVLCCAAPQPQVGTVVRTGEDDDPIAVMTVLNTQQHGKAAFMQQIKSHMLDKCSDAAAKQQLSKVRILFISSCSFIRCACFSCTSWHGCKVRRSTHNAMHCTVMTGGYVMWFDSLARQILRILSIYSLSAHHCN